MLDSCIRALRVTWWQTCLAKANAKTHQLEHTYSSLHVFNSFALLSKTPFGKPESVLVIEYSIVRQVISAGPLGCQMQWLGVSGH